MGFLYTAEPFRDDDMISGGYFRPTVGQSLQCDGSGKSEALPDVSGIGSRMVGSESGRK
jgi:hypothetical protein